MNWFEPTKEQIASWEAWVASRPPKVRAVAEKLKPWKLYRIGSGHRVTLYSIDEEQDGSISLRVHVTGKFNLVSMERCVFGIDPESLVECELPLPDEPVGSMDLTVEQVKRVVKALGAQEN